MTQQKKQNKQKYTNYKQVKLKNLFGHFGWLSKPYHNGVAIM